MAVLAPKRMRERFKSVEGFL